MLRHFSYNLSDFFFVGVSLLHLLLPRSTAANLPCGVDFSPISRVYEGFAKIETYPWLGRLFYAPGGNETTTTVVLVTMELVIGSAFDIEKYPKNDFRKTSRVVLGSSCLTGPMYNVLDYTYYYDYNVSSHSSLAILQLDIDDLDYDLKPICPPARLVVEPEFYAITVAKDCTKSTIKMYKMRYVDDKDCKNYYRKSGLDVNSWWPKHAVCAKATSGGKCIWRNGVVLVLRQEGRWKIAGIGVYGPGCTSPSRFLDYGMYHSWVKTSIARIGRPAVTRISQDYLVLRRSCIEAAPSVPMLYHTFPICPALARIQRFGPCDSEEMEVKVYTDHMIIEPNWEINIIDFVFNRTARYNLTLFTHVDYQCIVITVKSFQMANFNRLPLVRLRRWCNSLKRICYEFGFLQIELYVEVEYVGDFNLLVEVYGRPIRLIERKPFHRFVNQDKKYPPIRPG